MSDKLKTVFDATKPLAPQISIDWLRSVATMWNELNILGGIIDRATWTIIPGASSSSTAEASTYSFQCTGIGTSAVAVASGSCQYGANTAVAMTAQSFAVASNARIYVSLNLDTGAWAGPFKGSDSDPIDTGNTEYYMIANVTTVGGVITAIRQRILGDIYESKV